MALSMWSDAANTLRIAFELDPNNEDIKKLLFEVEFFSRHLETLRGNIFPAVFLIKRNKKCKKDC